MKRIHFKDTLARFIVDGARALHATPLHVALLVIFLQPATAQRLVTPFSGKLPSEIYFASLYPENSFSDIMAKSITCCSLSALLPVPVMAAVALSEKHCPSWTVSGGLCWDVWFMAFIAGKMSEP
jgi:hypothetical protein